MTDFPRLFDCPCCGQGGLELVRIKSSPPTVAVACSECDRTWVAPSKVSVNNDTELSVVLSKFGLTNTWESLERIHQGIHWDDLGTDFQSILFAKSSTKPLGDQD